MLHAWNGGRASWYGGKYGDKTGWELNSSGFNIKVHSKLRTDSSRPAHTGLDLWLYSESIVSLVETIFAGPDDGPWGKLKAALARRCLMWLCDNDQDRMIQLLAINDVLQKTTAEIMAEHEVKKKTGG